MAIRDYIDALSEEQQAAARFTRDPVLALAGAGSGKTRMLMGRFAYLVLPTELGGLGADPASVMMVTFTNKAAREMRERIQPILEDLRDFDSGSWVGEPWIGTFHGLSLRILRVESDKAGLGRNFSIFDESDARSLANDVVEEMGIDAFDVDEFFKDLETAKARMLDPAFLLSGKKKLEAGAQGVERDRWRKILDHFESNDFVEIYERYQHALQEQNAVDFNDLLNRTTRLMQQSQEVRDSWRSTFRHFMVDEVQDINRAQVAWLTAMTDGAAPMQVPEGARTSEHGEAHEGTHEINTYRVRKFPRPTVAFVGDDDQSIYAFRGSEVAVMRGLERRFPGLEKKFLKTSYRCQPSILALSNELVGRNTGRYGKDLVPHAGAQAYGPVRFSKHERPEDEIANIRREAEAYISEGGDPSEFAVLTRTRDLAKAVAKGLRAGGLPVVEGKSSDLRKTQEVKDVMGFVTFLTNTDAEVPLRRIINKPSRGLGPTSLRKVTHNARLKNVTFLEELNTVIGDRIEVPDGGEAYKPAFIRSAKAFGRLVTDMREAVTIAPDARTALTEVMQRSGLLGEMYRDALKAAGKSDTDGTLSELPPRDFLKWLISSGVDSRGGKESQESLLEGEELADKAGQMSTAARRIGNVALLLDESDGFDSLDAFAQESVLEMSQGQAPSGVQVLTMHASKGLEFDHVRLPFWLEGVMPHGRAVDGGHEDIEEERRLAYVAMTRGRKTVEISRAWNISACPFIRQRENDQSRFITEMTVDAQATRRVNAEAPRGAKRRTIYIRDKHRDAFPGDSGTFAYEMAPITAAEPEPAAGVGGQIGSDRVPMAPEDSVSYEERFADAPPPIPDDFDAIPDSPWDGMEVDPDWDPRFDEMPELDLDTPPQPEQDDDDARDPVPF